MTWLLILEDGSIPGALYSYCIARKERRLCFDKNTNTKRTPMKETDTHYHLKKSCILNIEPSFRSEFLCVPEDIDLTNAHFTYIETEFGLKSAIWCCSYSSTLLLVTIILGVVKMGHSISTWPMVPQEPPQDWMKLSIFVCSYKIKKSWKVEFITLKWFQDMATWNFAKFWAG